jgi:DNA-binding SARP family transcriptional activator/class 3 adenylate cyclase
MDFRILGPLEVREGEREIRVRGGKQRALLALLLVNANRTLAIDRIVDELWGADVPDSAHKMVQIHVSKLRKALAPGLLHTRPPGYSLDVDPEDVDLHRFERLVSDARVALDADGAEAAAAGFRAALDLWRGPALAEFATEPFASAEGARLEEVRLAALEGRLEADLLLGRHGDLVGELEALVARHPLRESLRRQQMLALYRSGRQAEALTAYQQARRALADELGIEPSPALRALERLILQQDASLDPAAPADAAPAPEPEPDPVHEEPARDEQQEAPDEMLKLVTVVFADVAAPTAVAEPRHPEDVRDLTTGYFAAVAPEIRSAGGTIEKLVGGGIMAVFGVPAVHEDDAVRAVRAAWGMVERLRAWNEGRDPAETLEIRVGVSTGEALASGAPGGELRVTSDVIGLAASLRQAAAPGTIVVADRTAHAVRARFALRPLEAGTWLVEGHRDAEEPGWIPGIESPLVGRERELALLATTFERVRLEGRPALVTVVGDAGVGKSRLAREFLWTLGDEPRVLIGRCLALEQGVTLWPLAEMLKGEAGVLDTDRADDASAKLASLVERTVAPGSGGDHGRVVAALASTLGLRLPADPLGSLDPRDLYHELVGAWLVLLASMSRGAPVVAVVEDVHWADPTMLDVLDDLAERLDGPVLFVCTARPDLLRSRPDWGGGRRNFSSVPLDPLSGEESARLASLLPGVDELPDGVRRLILERAGGNPFFLEEIVRRLVNDGLLAWEEGRWSARVGIEQVEIPDNVQAVILSRLDLLAPDERRVAQRAAVVGRVFWDGALARLAGGDDLDAALRTLRRREFVLERLSSSIPGQREYAFKHVLIRDVAYASLPRAERGRAHAATAAWIEETSGERTDELAELLAHHYDSAFSLLRDEGFRRRARGYLLAGAAQAHRRFAIRQGDRLARRAVELSDGPAERVESLEALGDLEYLAFLGDAAWHTYVEALAELADGDAAYARLAGKATLFSTRFLGTMQTLPAIETVRGIVERGLLAAPEPGAERTLLLVNRGFLLVQRDGRRDEAAEATVREAEAAAEELGDPDLLSAALDLVATHEEDDGRYGDAYRTDLRRNTLVGRMTDVKEIGDALAVAARKAHHLGRFREAEAHASACIERARGVDSGSYLHGLTWRVAARFALGEWDDALADQAELERVVAVGAGELPPPLVMGAYTRAALCHELRGERGEAERYVELSLRYFARVRHARVGGSIHLPPLALALARQERFDEALALVPHVPRTLSAGATLEVMCEIAAMQERWDEGLRLAAAARDEAQVGEQLGLPLFADRVEGRAAAARGDAAEAGELLGRSANGFAAIGARWEEAWSRLLRAEAAGSGERELAERELAAALPVLESLGSAREAARARALLAAVAV